MSPQQAGKKWDHLARLLYKPQSQLLHIQTQMPAGKSCWTVNIPSNLIARARKSRSMGKYTLKSIRNNILPGTGNHLDRFNHSRRPGFLRNITYIKMKSGNRELSSRELATIPEDPTPLSDLLGLLHIGGAHIVDLSACMGRSPGTQKSSNHKALRCPNARAS